VLNDSPRLSIGVIPTIWNARKSAETTQQVLTVDRAEAREDRWTKPGRFVSAVLSPPSGEPATQTVPMCSTTSGAAATHGVGIRNWATSAPWSSRPALCQPDLPATKPAAAQSPPDRGNAGQRGRPYSLIGNEGRPWGAGRTVRLVNRKPECNTAPIRPALDGFEALRL